MLTAARRVSAYIKNRRVADIEPAGMLRDAVERQLEIVGEAARRVSEETRDAHPEVPWSRIIAQRNVISHEYGEIKAEWIWLVATERVPELITLLESITPQDPAV